MKSQPPLGFPEPLGSHDGRELPLRAGLPTDAGDEIIKLLHDVIVGPSRVSPGADTVADEVEAAMRRKSSPVGELDW